MNRPRSPTQTAARSPATGSFLSGLLQDLKLDAERVEIVSDNARTKRIRRPLHHETSQKAKCRWSNMVDDATMSPSTSTSTSSRRQMLLMQQQHVRSPSSGTARTKQSPPSQVNPSPVDSSMRWDDVVVDKQKNAGNAAITTSLRDLMKDQRIDGCNNVPSDLAPTSPSISEHGLLPPTRQISIESEKGRGMSREDDEESVDLEQEQERLKEKRADKPLLVPKRGGFVNKQPKRSNSISDSSVVGVMSKVQHTWNQRYSSKRHQRPGIARANSMSCIHGAQSRTRPKDNTTALLNLVKRVDRIMLEDSFPRGSIPSDAVAQGSSSSIDSALVADTTPSLPVRRTSLEKDKSRKKKRGTKKQQQQQQQRQPRPQFQRAASTSKLLTTKMNMIDPFLYNDSTHVVEEVESNGTRKKHQPHLLRSAEVRTPTPPRHGVRGGSECNKNPSPRAEAAASALEEALVIATAPGRATNTEGDEDDLSVCSQIYSDVED